jgi:hypothetical protein
MIRIKSGSGTSKTKMVPKKEKNERIFIEHFGRHGNYFDGLLNLDPDPLVRGTGTVRMRIWILLSSRENSKKTLIPNVLRLLYDFYL